MSDKIRTDVESYFKKSNYDIISNRESFVLSEGVVDYCFGGPSIHALCTSLHVDLNFSI